MAAMTSDTVYDVCIVGAGASGSALLYTLARYTTIKSIALVEKYEEVGSVNTRANNNSQTLHIGDIETNYPLQKVRDVAPAASMVAHYAQSLPEEKRSRILFPVHKMVIGVGESEVQALERRYEELTEVFPELRKLGRKEIAEIEPLVVKGRKTDESLIALGQWGYAVDYQMLARSFVDETLARPDADRVRLLLKTPVLDIQRDKDIWVLKHGTGSLRARVVVFDADAYSLLFAKRLGLGLQYSLIPIAGTFFFTPQVLNGKVYTVQDPRLPFSAIHGDPDVRVSGKTRWGPTARFFPVLEARQWRTMFDYLRVSGLHRFRTWVSFVIILLDPPRFWYLVRNLLYEIPLFSRFYFARKVQRIVPSLSWKDVRRARGFGGMRLQRVDTRTHDLLLGEGKIVGDNIIFNMTPSPGASVCLYNARRDAEHIAEFLHNPKLFDTKRMDAELCKGYARVPATDTSLPDSYAS